MEQDQGGSQANQIPKRFDPRLYQIASLSTLLLYGLVWLHFEISIWHICITLGAALLTQYAGTRFYKLPSFDPRSPLISALSLCLLLRTDNLAIAALAACIAIGSKFVIRWKDKHLFNPTSLALVIMLACGFGWISPGQWGQVAWFGFLIACLGILVVTRAARADVTLAFLAFYVGLLFTRAVWLGDPLTIPLHQIESGALLIFAFFMISDPKTTPDSRTGRIIFALMVALAALYVQFGLFYPNGPLWGLIACAPLEPLLDYLLPGSRYEWSNRMLKKSAIGVLASLRPSTLRGRYSEVGSTGGAFPFAKIHSEGERPSRSAVSTSSALRSLRPCWTAFLSTLQSVLLLCHTCKPSKFCRAKIVVSQPPEPSSDRPSATLTNPVPVPISLHQQRRFS